VQFQNTRYLSRWASELDTPSDQTAFFNFLASHDGIGVNPVRGILPEGEINQLVSIIQQVGGLVSYKANSDGSQSPYELNVNYFDAMGRADSPMTEDEMIGRFLTAHSVLLTLKGLPAIYIHSLIGSRGWREGVSLTGANRTINRQKLVVENVLAEINDLNSRRAKIWKGFQKMLKARRDERAFAPQAGQKIFHQDERVFALMRLDPQMERDVFCVHNFSNETVTVELPDSINRWMDLLSPTEEEYRQVVSLLPYQYRWMIRSTL
jgi:sucrose phosphorylase